MSEPTNPPPSISPLSSLRWWRMTLKELREILRDRRTIITLIGMPILIYPLLGVTFQKLLVSQAITKSKIVYRIAFANNFDYQMLNNLWREADRSKGETAHPAPQEHAGTQEDPDWEVFAKNDPNVIVDVDQLVSERVVDVGVRFKRDSDDAPWKIEISYRPSSTFSIDAFRAIEDKLRSVNDQFIERVLHDRDPAIKLPLDIHKRPVAATDSSPSFSMATLIPLILILMTVTGAVYPAIDLTAGERERGTLEALIAAPVPRYELLFAKYLAVLTVAMLTALANLTSMVITAYSNGLEQLLFGSAGINVRMLGLILGLLILFAGFFASVILILTSFARSFKEAQAYLIPVMLVSLAPGVVCLMPGIEMTTWMSVTPLVNIVILSRDVVDGRAQSVWVLSTLISTVLYSTVALSIAAKIFGTDAVLYGSEGSWVDLFQRPAKPRASATLTQAMGCLAFLFPAFLILSGLPTRLTGESIAGHVIGNAVITILLFAAAPLTLASWNHVAWSSGFRLRQSNLACFGAAVILGVSLWPFAIELARWQFSNIEQNGTVQELFRKIAARFEQIPLSAKLIALALIPATCEELFFRGYLMTALRSGMSTPLAVISSSCLFGLFHVIATMSFERFLPTCFLGLILGWVCVQSGSVLPGMLLHITHNSLILLMQTYVKKLTWLGLNSETDLRIPTTWLVGAAVLVTIGALIMKWGSPRRFTDRIIDAPIGSAGIQEL